MNIQPSKIKAKKCPTCTVIEDVQIFRTPNEALQFKCPISGYGCEAGSCAAWQQLHRAYFKGDRGFCAALHGNNPLLLAALRKKDCHCDSTGDDAA